MGIIDFDTSCPWEIYLFALVHIIGAATLYLFDSCLLLTSTSCTSAESVWERFLALSLLFVGVIYAVLTYHGKQLPGKITRLSKIALMCSTALLVSVVFAGNASFGGIERSWMHKGDVITGIILVYVLSARVSKTGTEWAEKEPLNARMGLNCKALVFIFMVLTGVKFLALTDFIDPLKLLADESEMTDYSTWMWKFTAVLVFEIHLAFVYAVLFDDNAGHEILVSTMIIMYLVAAASIYPIQSKLSSWMGLNSNVLWTRMGIAILICVAAIAGGRHGNSDRTGYQNV